MSTPTRLQLSLHAQKLSNVAGMLHKSDPFAVVTVLGEDPDNPEPIVLGQTEVIYNNLSPCWATLLILDGFRFGRPLYFEVGVFDYHHKHRRQSGAVDASSSSSRPPRSSTSVASSSSSQSQQSNLPKHKCMGTALFEVGAILGSRGNVGSKSLKSGGAVYVRIERSRRRDDSSRRRGRGGGGGSGGGGDIRFRICGLGLSNTQNELLNRKSSPFFEVYRRVDAPSGGVIWNPVYRSTAIRSNLNPRWDVATIDLERFCNGDLDRRIKIGVWDHRRTGKHKSMGEFETSVRRFVDAATTSTTTKERRREEGGESDDEEDGDDSDAKDLELAFALRRKEKKVGRVVVLEAQIVEESEDDDADGNDAGKRRGRGGGSKKDSGRSKNGVGTSSSSSSCARRPVPLSSSTSSSRPQFVDYLSGGCEISLAVAIDFTASNGDPRVAGTPHYFHPSASDKWNDYEKAILAVGSILAKFDSDQMFPLWGFGAKYSDEVRHCFQCGDRVEIHGVKGLLEAYRAVFQTPLTMSYPTVFTEVVRTAGGYANRKQAAAFEHGKLAYTILLILTAGDVHEVKETKIELAKASAAPLSVVIVGIGDADFSGMQFLDDHDPEIDPGRDITKFVQFNEYKSFNDLTGAVLDEIPDQLVEYFFERGILPSETEAVDGGEVEVQPADDERRGETPSRFFRAK